MTAGGFTTSILTAAAAAGSGLITSGLAASDSVVSVLVSALGVETVAVLVSSADAILTSGTTIGGNATLAEAAGSTGSAGAADLVNSDHELSAAGAETDVAGSVTAVGASALPSHESKAC
jgi:hypothetical protein